MNSVVTPTVSLQDRAQRLLDTVQIVYLGHSDGAYTFTVTQDGEAHTPVYDGQSRCWRCDCDGFDPEQGQCLHTELVKAWRRTQQDIHSQVTPPPPATNGQGSPPSPPPLRQIQGNGGSSSQVPGRASPASVFPTVATGVSAWKAKIAQALFAPFPVEMVGWKAQTTTRDGSRALAVAYVDARAVQDRLDSVVGPENWSDDYRVLGTQSGSFGAEIVVECRLTVLGVTKSDVGVGEDHKSAYSDAFKRAAVKFGIGRFLYSLPKRWVAYDSQKKQLKETPQLPSWAVPS